MTFICRSFLCACLSVLFLSAVASPIGPASFEESQKALDKRADEADRTGTRLLNEGRYAEALEEFRRLEKYAPHLPQGYGMEGVALALTGKLEEATEALKKALKIDPSFWVARRELGIVYWHRNMKPEAAKELYPIVQMFPNDSAVNSILGQYEYERQNYSQALSFFARARSEVEADPRFSLMELQALLKTGQANQASDKLEQMLSRRDLAPPQKFQLAWLLGESKQYRKAIEVFDSLPKDYPDPFTHGYGVALAYFMDGEYPQCIQILTALKASSTMPELYSLLGVAYEKNGQTLVAYEAFRQGIYANPKDARNYLNIATLASEHGNYDLAVQILSSGLELMPEDYKLLVSRGVAHSLQGRLKLAQGDYRKALEMVPQEVETYLALGLAHFEAGEMDSAIEIFERATAKGFKDPRPHFFLTEALLRKGLRPGTEEFQRATQAVEAALSLDPNFAYAYVDRARLALKAEQTAKAISDLERARTLEPQSSTIAYVLAQAYMRAGEKAKADELFALVKESSVEELQRFRQAKLKDILVTLSGGSR